jgi:hypothetical protein
VLAAKYEKLGIPTVNIVTTSVGSVARKQSTSVSEAMPHLRIINIPSVGQEAKKTLALSIVPKIVEALTKPLTEQERYAGKFELPKEPRIAFTGTLDDVQDFFLGDLSKYTTTAPHAEYTDGLPVIPPTPDRVANMLKGTRHKPDEVLGQIEPFNGIATVEKVAINAVMAGARPEYMPVLLALTENMSHGTLRDSAQGADGVFGYSVVVCGPVARVIGLNSGGPQQTGPAPFSPGVPANMTIGRFVRLMMLNVGGIEPGVSEAKWMGNPHKTSVVIAEDNEGSPWPQMSADLGLGFKNKESTITLFSGWVDILAGVGPTLKDIGATKAQITDPDVRAKWLTCVANAATGLSRPQQGLLYFMGPDVAREIANAGYSRKDVQNWIYEHAVAPWGKAKQQAWIGMLLPSLTSLPVTIQGKPVPLYPKELNDPNLPDDTLIKYFAGPEMITIIVGPGAPAPRAGGFLMTGQPRWTTAVDKWR